MSAMFAALIKMIALTIFSADFAVSLAKITMGLVGAIGAARFFSPIELRLKIGHVYDKIVGKVAEITHVKRI